MESASVSTGGPAGGLAFVGPEELARIRSLDCPPEARAEVFADACRLNALSMITEAGSGHVGTSFSCMDILAWLHLEVLQPGDRYFSSKGTTPPPCTRPSSGPGASTGSSCTGSGGLAGSPGIPTWVPPRRC